MPEIKRFGSCKLLMYFQNENPPHVHIKGPDFTGKLRLSDGELIVGKAPNKVLREVRSWIAANRVQLLRLWDEFQS